MSWAQELGTPADRLVRTRHNREAATPEAVAELIDWYRARWEIESAAKRTLLRFTGKQVKLIIFAVTPNCAFCQAP